MESRTGCFEKQWFFAGHFSSKIATKLVRTSYIKSCLFRFGFHYSKCFLSLTFGNTDVIWCFELAIVPDRTADKSTINFQTFWIPVRASNAFCKTKDEWYQICSYLYTWRKLHSARHSSCESKQLDHWVPILRRMGAGLYYIFLWIKQLGRNIGYFAFIRNWS